MNRKELTNLKNMITTDASEEAIKRHITREGAVTFLNASHLTVVLDRQTECRQTLIWVIGGHASTNSKGEALINLNDYLCFDHDENSIESQLRPSITNQPWFVAIPVSTSPVLLTTNKTMKSIARPGNIAIDHKPSNSPTVFDIGVQVTSWHLDGSHAANVEFSWNCLVEGTRWTSYG